ncbi:hypothetical protein NKG05_03175 [Oerskovia sp. M15]
MTLRQALQILESDGMIESRPAREPTRPADGTPTTCCTSPVSRTIYERRARRSRRASSRPRTTYRRRRRAAAGHRSDRTSAHGHPPAHHRCAPFVLQHSYLPAIVSVDPDELVDASLYQVLAQHSTRRLRRGVHHHHHAQQRRGRAAGPPENSPAMLSLRTHRTEDGVPVLYDSGIIPADVAAIHIDRGPQRVRVAYRINDRPTSGRRTTP